MRTTPIGTLKALLILGAATFVQAAEAQLDAMFGSAGLVLTAAAKNSSISGPVLQTDGKILFCGAREVAPSGSRVLVVRLTAAGMPDAATVYLEPRSHQPTRSVPHRWHKSALPSTQIVGDWARWPTESGFRMKQDS